MDLEAKTLSGSILVNYLDIHHLRRNVVTVVGQVVALKRYVHIPEPVNVTLFGKTVFADMIKDFKMTSP